MVRVDFFVRDTNDKTVFYEMLSFADQKAARDAMGFLRDVLGCEIETRVPDWKYWIVLRAKGR